MLDFYTLDITNITISFLTSVFVYLILDNMKSEKDNDEIIKNMFFSLVLGVIFSLLISYLTIESDELLTSNYWE
tara:strand:- start:213 stop:434 length:222 start_codon:yes stop_codon:yes gene_type:complete